MLILSHCYKAFGIYLYLAYSYKTGIFPNFFFLTFIFMPKSYFTLVKLIFYVTTGILYILRWGMRE